MLKRLSF
jgi:hypothetical protein